MTRKSISDNPEDIHILNIRLPEEVSLLWIDSLVDTGAYGSRSEVIRDFLRDYVKEAPT